MLTRRQYGRAKRLWAEGVPLREIAERTGIKYSTLLTYTSRRREDFPRRYGEVSEGTLESAFSMRCDGRMTFREIAEELGVPCHTVVYWFTRGRLGERYREFQAEQDLRDRS